MTNTIAQWFVQTFGGKISPELIIFIVSRIPILELRGGLLVASLLHVKMWTAIPICIIGNIIPVPFILLLITKTFSVLKKTKTFRKPVNWLEARAMGKSDRIRRGEFIGLMLFVGIPLPGTGAWTGTLAAEGVPAAAWPSELKAANVVWRVAEVNDDSPGELPFIVTKNYNGPDTFTENDAAGNDAPIALNPREKPFGKRRVVWFTIWGASMDARKDEFTVSTFLGNVELQGQLNIWGM